MDIISKEPQQYLVYLGLSLLILALTGILTFRNRPLLQPFFGVIHPVLAILLVILAGAILLILLLSRGLFVIYQSGDRNGLLIAAGLGALLSLAMILVDCRVVLPEDINRPFPDSILFYPIMGFVVEIVFHLLPLAVFLLALTSLFKQFRFEAVFWPCVFIIATFETAYQVQVGLSRPYPAWVLGAIALLVFLINTFELLLFRRYDFVSMYALRLAYYFLWHVAWGYVRLKLLF